MISLWSSVPAGVLLAALSVPATWHPVQSAEGNASYQEGRLALDRGAWAEAVAAFERAAEDDALVDAALYWQAYAHNRGGQVERAIELVSEISRRFPQSRWREAARTLAAEIRGISAEAVGGGDEELKLMALNGLMHMEEGEAIPILEEILAGSQSAKLKERALFVLAQMDSEPAFGVLARVARTAAPGELQRKAIRYLGIHESERSLALLEELYGSLQNESARADVLHAFMIAGEKQRILERARNEPNAELRGRAIHWLGTMDASAELWELYERESSEDVKKKILHALFVAGNTERLEAVANDPSESDEIRKAAIHSLGVSGDEARGPLVAIYQKDGSAEMKKQVLHSLFIQDAATELVEIARTETSPELKKSAVHWLSLMDAPEAKDFLMELLRQ